MYLAYSLLLSLGLLVLLPYFLFQALAHGKYLDGLRQRLGRVPQINGKPVIWLHCVSVGETQASRPLAQRLKQQFPHHALVVSTVTLTGQKLARDVFRNQADSVIYFPFDWRWSVRRTFKSINPAAVVIMETELWPNFLRECRARHIPVALVNGRISHKSFKRYFLIQPFIRRVLSSLSIAVMQSEADAQRLQILGMPVDKLFTGGNLKFDAEVGSDLADKTAEISERFDLNSNVPLILAASTHAPEEQIILESFKQLKATQPVRLMLAPRHPERFNEVASLVQKSGLSWSRRTNAAAANDREAEVVLLDTIGELPAVYSLAEIVFVGGSIVNRGGHNVLEPAAAGTVVVTGAHTHNFQAIVSKMREASAIIQLHALEGDEAVRDLTEALTHLFADPEWREKLARRAKQLVTDNRGATERTMQLIAPLLTTRQPGRSESDSILANAHTS
ncbi:MAG TPA: 3-deoxy-D-manno-octulosonic acid transferase [Pyrinomonadaceae bacterium]|nr:3-deoxy-D-manno-octulosonic acid transferase [Pyrinomonadaceae bacterium]